MAKLRVEGDFDESPEAMIKSFEITRKTMASVRIKPYGATNRAASRTYSREFFDQNFVITEPGVCEARPKRVGSCNCSRMFGGHSLNCPANTHGRWY